MKKILLLLIGLTIISCSSDDDNTRTTDPLIGVWETEFRGARTIYTVNTNGTFVRLYEYDDDHNEKYLEGTTNGEWSNRGSDFNSLGQTYALSFEGGGLDMYYMDDDNTRTLAPVFSEDFNSWTYDGDPYTRQ